MLVSEIAFSVLGVHISFKTKGKILLFDTINDCMECEDEIFLKDALVLLLW